ncbi:MAG: phospholipid carrier-dependent glycosyltransferase [Oscillatoria sp. SIO1A7]|nr:phospholipid carrier-dependent glycosyltransferase [Oscillatoria sp. SIO1A7]
MTDKGKSGKSGKSIYPLRALGLIWLLGALCDRLWFALDRSVPAWDQADYLTGAANYWRSLQNPHWLDGDWWQSLWLLSSKIPPGTYIATAFVHNLCGLGGDRATLINLGFSAILLASVYGLGTRLFNPQVGIWAAGFCLLFPGLYRARLDFLLDYPLTAACTLSFYCLTAWKLAAWQENAREKRKLFYSFFWAIAFGLSLGLALMVKQPAILFLLAPVLWVAGAAIRRRNWLNLAQLALALLLSAAVIYPWYRTNWLLVLTGSKRATIDAAIAEGDPALNSLSAWTYYLDKIPELVSWPLLIVGLLGCLIYGWSNGWVAEQEEQDSQSNSYQTPPSSQPPQSPHLPHTPHPPSSLEWLVVFWLGAYLLCSLNVNKDPRYILPILPVCSIFLACGFTLWVGRWGKLLRWGTCGLAIALMLFSLWPVEDWAKRTPGEHHAYIGLKWPHENAIAEIVSAQPYLRATIGVLPSTAEINQHNFNYYGALADFQVYGRQVGTRRSQIAQDTRSLSWFITKTGEQGSVPEAQKIISEAIEQSPDFQLHKSWPLPDGSTLKLYRRQTRSVEVQKLQESPPPAKVALEQVALPTEAPPGMPVPIAYQWKGSWQQLRSGLVLLTWSATDKSSDRLNTSRRTGDTRVPPAETGETPVLRDTRWFHDRAIGMGELHSANPTASGGFRVWERTAMLPPADLAPGNYELEAIYLNRITGETYPIAMPPVTLRIDPKAPALAAPELDLVTQERSLGAALPLGTDALDSIFSEVARINQYDPTQDYLKQSELALEYRLEQEPDNLEFLYALALARVLQRNAPEAIATLERVVQLDPNNPYAYAYLAFVNLYDWHPVAAEAALKPARQLAGDRKEIQVLSAVAALMRGNLVQMADYLGEYVR